MAGCASPERGPVGAVLLVEDAIDRNRQAPLGAACTISNCQMAILNLNTGILHIAQPIDNR